MRRLIAPCFFVVLAACAPQSRFPTIDSKLAEDEANRQREMVIETRTKRTTRLGSVSFRVQTANADLCGDKKRPMTGLIMAWREGLPDEYKPIFNRLFRNTDQPVVLATVPDGPAARAGIMRGDALMAVNGTDIKAGKAGYEQSSEIGRAATGVIRFDLLSDERRTVTVDPIIGCDYPASLVEHDMVNAFADGTKINVTTGMMKFIESDDELALVLGHELAHNTMGHIAAKQGNAMIGAVIGAIVSAALRTNVTNSFSNIAGGAFSQDFEAEADYVGVYHAARAGYDTAGAAALWRRMATEKPEAIGLGGTTHPSTAKRFVAIETATKEVADKRAAGLPLKPEMKATEEAKTPATAPSPAGTGMAGM